MIGWFISSYDPMLIFCDATNERKIVRSFGTDRNLVLHPDRFARWARCLLKSPSLGFYGEERAATIKNLKIFD